MKRIEVTFEMNIDDVAKAHIEEWLEYKLGYINIMSKSNPLENKDLEATYLKFKEF